MAIPGALHKQLAQPEALSQSSIPAREERTEGTETGQTRPWEASPLGLGMTPGQTWGMGPSKTQNEVAML